jgi:hypothetical protein
MMPALNLGTSALAVSEFWGGDGKTWRAPSAGFCGEERAGRRAASPCNRAPSVGEWRLHRFPKEASRHGA